MAALDTFLVAWVSTDDAKLTMSHQVGCEDLTTALMVRRSLELVGFTDVEIRQWQKAVRYATHTSPGGYRVVK